MDWAGRTEGRGNAGETAGFVFHPSGPLEFGYLIQLKGLIYQLKLAPGAGRAPFHPVNPGLGIMFPGGKFLRGSRLQTIDASAVSAPNFLRTTRQSPLFGKRGSSGVHQWT